MATKTERAAAAELFRTLGSEPRLTLLEALIDGPLSVSALADKTGMAQPMVSQHLRLLRSVGVVNVEHVGREHIHRVSDEHVVHVVRDTIAHVGEVNAPDPH